MKIVLFILGFLLNIQVSAQVLSVNNLIAIYQRDEDGIDVYLGNKGWERSPTSSDAVEATWAFDRRLKVFEEGQGPSYEAEAWVSTVNDEGTRIITYSIHNLDKFSAFRAQVLALGMRKVEYTSSSKRVIAEYEGAKYKLKLITRINEGSLSENNSYLIYLEKKK